MIEIVVWYAIGDSGDGNGANINWYLTFGEAKIHRYEGFDLTCGSVETFVGSDIHAEAVSNGLNTE